MEISMGKYFKDSNYHTSKGRFKDSHRLAAATPPTQIIDGVIRLLGTFSKFKTRDYLLRLTSGFRTTARMIKADEQLILDATSLLEAAVQANKTATDDIMKKVKQLQDEVEQLKIESTAYPVMHQKPAPPEINERAQALDTEAKKLLIDINALNDTTKTKVNDTIKEFNVKSRQGYIYWNEDLANPTFDHHNINIQQLEKNAVKLGLKPEEYNASMETLFKKGPIKFIQAGFSALNDRRTKAAVAPFLDVKFRFENPNGEPIELTFEGLLNRMISQTGSAGRTSSDPFLKPIKADAERLKQHITEFSSVIAKTQFYGAIGTVKTILMALAIYLTVSAISPVVKSRAPATLPINPGRPQIPVRDSSGNTIRGFPQPTPPPAPSSLPRPGRIPSGGFRGYLPDGAPRTR
jgi:hypothetical protein